MELSAMIVACALIGLLGYLYCSFPLNKIPALVAAILAMTMILERGYYWVIFERGEGFFTANRLSGLAVLVGCWVAGTVAGDRHWRRAGAQVLAEGAMPARAEGIFVPIGKVWRKVVKSKETPIWLAIFMICVLGLSMKFLVGRPTEPDYAPSANVTEIVVPSGNTKSAASPPPDVPSWDPTSFGGGAAASPAIPQPSTDRHQLYGAFDPSSVPLAKGPEDMPLTEEQKRQRSLLKRVLREDQERAEAAANAQDDGNMM